MSSPRPFVPRKRPAPVPGLWRHALAHLAQGKLHEGIERELFERAVSSRLGDRPVVSLGSGRFALLLLLKAMGVDPPARIILPAFNASCVPNALQAAGYTLFFVDIDATTLHLDPQRLPKKPPEDAEVLIVTHLEGSPAAMKPLKSWAKTHGLYVIEDAAHALGASLNGAPVGALADGAIFSLGRGKHLNTLGGGLAVAASSDVGERLRTLARSLPTDSSRRLAQSVLMEGLVAAGTNPAVFRAALAPGLRLARAFGSDPMAALFEDDKDRLPGVPQPWQRRLSNLQAHYGLRGLAVFERQLARRRVIASQIVAGLKDCVTIQSPTEGAAPAWLECTVLVDRRDAFQAALLKRGVDTQRTWMDACDRLPAFEEATGEHCPVAEDVGMRALYLPTYASLSDTQVDHIIRSVRAVVAEQRS